MEDDCGAKVTKAPVKPTQDMIDEHEVHHLRFRSWFSFCVRGRATSVGHFEVNHDDEQVPLLAIDYGFLGAAAFLAIKDRHTKSLWSDMVPNKGLQPSLYGAKALLAAIEQTGYKRPILKSDKEPAILSVYAYAKAQFAGEVLPEAPLAEGHEFSNG